MLKQSRFIVFVNQPDGEVAEHDVTITHQDQLRAEQMGVQLKLPSIQEAPGTATTLWCWAALKRLGVLDSKPRDFLNVLCAGIQKPDGEDEEEVDPTDPGPDTVFA
jgi:hypothetical protein